MILNRNVEHQQEFFPGRLDVRAPITNLLSQRWSPRAFTDKGVEAEKLLSLFEAARWSPSSANDQPWRFLVATKVDGPIYDSLFSVLSESNKRWAHRAPVLVLGTARAAYSKTGRPHRHAWYDLGQSVAYLTVEAEALGLAVHQMGGFDAARAKEVLSIPEDYDPVIMIAIGYADVPESLPEDLRQREKTPRSRQPLEDLVFTKAWGASSPYVEIQASSANN